MPGTALALLLTQFSPKVDTIIISILQLSNILQ